MRKSLVTVAAAAMAVGPVGVASTTPPESGGASGGAPPAQAGEWVPAPDDFYAPFDAPACGSVVTVAPGDVREVEILERTLADGSTLTRFRGAATVDLVRQSDGAVVDELDISGPGYDLTSPEGESVLEFVGASILGPPNDVSAAAFEAAGLPELTYFTAGTVVIETTPDPGTGLPVQEQVLLVEADVVDACDLLDVAAAGGGSPTAHPVHHSTLPRSPTGPLTEQGPEWVPAPEEFYATTELEACGSVVTIAAGDVRAFEVRDRVLPDGTAVSQVRGESTVDLTRQSDGAVIDELDISGLAHDIAFPDRPQVVYGLWGASIFAAPDDVVRAGFEAEGLPHLFYYAEGYVAGRDTVDPDTGAPASVDLTVVAADVVDLCRVFDAVAGDRHGDRHHGEGSARHHG